MLANGLVGCSCFCSPLVPARSLSPVRTPARLGWAGAGLWGKSLAISGTALWAKSGLIVGQIQPPDLVFDMSVFDPQINSTLFPYLSLTKYYLL